jgi:tetratricopeptide (TPR) repeat protein
VKAIALYHEALRLNPDFAESHSNLGLELKKMGRTEDSIAEFQEAIRLNPDMAQARVNWGLSLDALGRTDEAIAQYEEAKEISPDLFAARYVLGTALMRVGRTSEAAEEFEGAIEDDPKSAEAHNSLASALWVLGKPEGAMKEWEAALRIKPNYPDALNALAWTLATDSSGYGDGKRALVLAQRACALTKYNVPDFMDTLAAAYAAVGQFDHAITIANKAIDLAQAQDNSLLAGLIENRLQLYEAGRPYRKAGGATQPVQ